MTFKETAGLLLMQWTTKGEKMSRTYRRKNGNKWWSEEDFTYVLNKEGEWIRNPSSEEVIWYKNHLISKFQKRDAFFGKTFPNLFVKKESNILRRTSKKDQVKKITIENYKDFEYNLCKEKLVKRISRYYD